MAEMLWQKKEFIAHLKSKYQLKITGPALDKYESTSGLQPNRLDNNYRVYSEKDVESMLKIRVMNYFLGIRHKDIRRIEGIHSRQHSSRAAKADSEYLYMLLCNPQLRLLTQEVGDFPKMLQLNKQLVEELLKHRENHPDNWYQTLDWYELYNHYKDFSPKEITSVDFAKIDDIVFQLIAKLDIDQIIEEVNEQLEDEFYYTAQDEIMERHDLDEFDEEQCSQEIVEEFYEELFYWVEQYEEETVLEKMESVLDDHLNAVKGTFELFPLMRDELESQFLAGIREKRESHISKLQERYEEKYKVFRPEDMELLSIVFSGEIRSLSYDILGIDAVLTYLDANYSALKKCMRELTVQYKDHMNHGVFSLYDIPDYVNTVLEAAARHGVEIVYSGEK
jgi:hypothetical protein